MDREQRRKLQMDCAKSGTVTGDIFNMCEEVCDKFVEGLSKCDGYMEFKAFTIRKFEDDEEGKKMTHWVDVFNVGFMGSLDHRIDLSSTEYDMDMTEEDVGDSVEIWYHARKK